MRKKKKNNYKSRFSTRLILYVLLFVLIINSSYIYNIFTGDIANITEANTKKKISKEKQKLQDLREEQEKKIEQNKKNGSVYYFNPSVDNTLENVVVDENNVLEVLNNLETGLGIDFEGEYQVLTSADYADGKIYSLQQYYNDIEVVSSILNVVVDSSGMIKFINGKHINVNNIESEPHIDESKAIEVALKYIIQEYQFDSNDIEVVSDGYKIAFDDQLDPKAGYLVKVFYQGYTQTTLFIDGNNGNVIFEQSETYTDRFEKELYGQNDSLKKLYVEHKDNFTLDTEFQLSDNESELEVYNANNKSREEALKEKNNQNLQIISWDEQWVLSGKPDVDPASVDALANLEIVYNFYNDILGRQGINNDLNKDNIPIFTHIKSFKDQNGNTHSLDFNAAMHKNEYMMIGNGSKDNPINKSMYLDVMGHEFTHGIISNDIVKNSISTSHEFGAINEGLADVFGELIDDYQDNKRLDGSKNCDWIHGLNRSCASPGDGQITNAADYTNNTKVHKGIYLISHPAYLMSHGINGDEKKKISNEQLAYFYYDVIAEFGLEYTFSSLLQPGSNFTDLRNILELLMYYPKYSAGKPYTFTEDQQECIMDALDSVGIPRRSDFSATPFSSINIYDINNDLYKNALVSLRRFDGKEVVKELEVKEGSFLLNGVAPGIYILTLTDSKTHNSQSYFLAINDNDDTPLELYKDKIDIFTRFGSKDANIALVLDVSGSMDGTPIEQVRSASTLFIDTIKNQAPNTNIDLITYDSEARVVSEANSDMEGLKTAVNSIGAVGSTNIQDALQKAKETLAGKEHRAIVIMSDGLPNEGDPGENGDYIQPIIDLANNIKGDNTFIYSFGFFHNIEGEELLQGQDLMKKIANENYSSIVTEANSPSVSEIFNNIASQIQNPGETEHIEIKCPVDVTVNYNGQTLSSSNKNRSTGADFGILTFAGENNEEKILNLKVGPDYEIVITGYDKGTMDYTVSYADKQGNYNDFRSFESIPVTEKTIMTSCVGKKKRTKLSVDENGDGIYEKTYYAHKNSKAKESKTDDLVNRYIFKVLGFLLMIIILINELRLILLKWGKRNMCPSCGKKLEQGIKFCGYCGEPVLPYKLFEMPQKKLWIFKVSISALLMLEVLIASSLYNSPATATFNRIKSNEFTTASMIYGNSVKGNRALKKYLCILTEQYLEKADKAYQNQKINKETTEIIFINIADMDVGSASSVAKNKINSLKESEGDQSLKQGVNR